MKVCKEIPDLWHQSKAPFLLLGESGTGKSYLAKEIHKLATGEKTKFLTVPLAAISENLFESELFGHCRGAFTGALQHRLGFCEVVGNGTLFLDEIGELSPENQKKLLYLLEERKYCPVGTCQEKIFDGKIIAATNKNLVSLVQEGKFRQDLYFRLQVFSWEIMPLRKNREKLSFMLEHYWNHWCQYYERNGLQVSKTCWEYLREYPWYGNIREVKNCMEYLSLTNKALIEVEDLPMWFRPTGLNERDGDTEKKLIQHPSTFQEALTKFEEKFICEALLFYRGRVNETSRRLEISKSTLIAKARKYGINVWQIKANCSSRQASQQCTA